jgi:hypothetical protein
MIDSKRLNDLERTLQDMTLGYTASNPKTYLKDVRELIDELKSTRIQLNDANDTIIRLQKALDKVDQTPGSLSTSPTSPVVDSYEYGDEDYRGD